MISPASTTPSIPSSRAASNTSPSSASRPQLQSQLGTLSVGSTMGFEDTGKARMQAKHTIRNLMRGRFSDSHPRQPHATPQSTSPCSSARPGATRSSAAPTLRPTVRIFLRVHCEQEPTSRSSITLTDQRDPLGLLRIRFDWQISERELETIRQYVLVAQRSLARRSYASFPTKT